MNPLYTELEVLKLQELYYYNLGTFVHDFFYNGNFPELLKEKFEGFRISTECSVLTRSQGLNLNYKIPSNTNAYRKPTVAGAMFWNTLPNELKLTSAKTTFKQKLKKILLERYKC